MGDNISRQAAIEHLKKWFHSKGWMVSDEDCKSILWDVPSTDRKGHWKIYDHVDRIGRVIGEKICVCDQCKETMTLPWRAKVPNFCPACGADMRGAEDESTI